MPGSRTPQTALPGIQTLPHDCEADSLTAELGPFACFPRVPMNGGFCREQQHDRQHQRQHHQ